MAEAADLVRNGDERDREMVVLRREAIEDLDEHRFVVGNQRALGAALLRIAERIEGSAAQALELRQKTKDGHHPGAERHLLRRASAPVLARDHRRSEVELEAQILAGK